VKGFLPPQAPGGESVPPPRWEARPPESADGARMVVATASQAPEVVQAGAHPPRNGQAMASLGIGLAGVGLLVVSVGLSFLVSLPCAIKAIALGRQGQRRAEGEGIGGWRAARWGVVLGIVGCVLCVLAAVGWVLVVALDLNIGTDFGRPGPSAPTEFSAVLAAVGRNRWIDRSH
jgi:hypothetical protein